MLSATIPEDGGYERHERYGNVSIVRAVRRNFDLTRYSLFFLTCCLSFLEEEITAVTYSLDGNFLATGDRSGNVRLHSVEQPEKPKRPASPSSSAEPPQLVPYFQYSSHVPRFDFLKSAEIESKINQITFLPPTNANPLMLTCNGMKRTVCVHLSSVFCSLPRSFPH